MTTELQRKLAEMSRELELLANELEKVEEPSCCREFLLSWRCRTLAKGLALESQQLEPEWY